jgi:hypothetical protein
MLAVATPNTFGGAVASTLVTGTVAAAAEADTNQRSSTTDEFQVTSGEVYYFRVSAKGHQFVPRDQAIGTLRQMKYDRASDVDE